MKPDEQGAPSAGGHDAWPSTGAIPHAGFIYRGPKDRLSLELNSGNESSGEKSIKFKHKTLARPRCVRHSSKLPRTPHEEALSEVT